MFRLKLKKKKSRNKEKNRLFMKHEHEYKTIQYEHADRTKFKKSDTGMRGTTKYI